MSVCVHVLRHKSEAHGHYAVLQKIGPIQEVPAHRSPSAEARVHCLPKGLRCYGNSRSDRKKGVMQEEERNTGLTSQLCPHSSPPSESHHSATETNTMTPAQPLTILSTHKQTHAQTRTLLSSAC